MKRLILMLAALMLASSYALADTWEADTSGNLKYLVETFEGALPEELHKAMAATPFAGDEVICGATLGHYAKRSETLLEKVGLIAVKHDGTTVLLSAHLREDGWRILPESEIFLRSGADFIITAKAPVSGRIPVLGSYQSEGLMLAVDYGGDVFLLRPVLGVERYEGIVEAQWFELYAYQRLDDKGNGVSILSGGESQPWTVCTHKDGVSTETGVYDIRWPVRTEYIDGDAFPRDAAELARWAEANPMDMDSWWVFSANLRMLPTTASKSYGKSIIAPLEVIMQTDGWTLARAGDTAAWISNTYVARAGQSYTGNHMLCQVAPVPVAKALKETELCVTAEGEEMEVLQAGTSMRILAATEAWYMVQLPEDAAQWKLDVPGRYGYVRRVDVATYVSPLCMKYDAK